MCAEVVQGFPLCLPQWHHDNLGGCAVAERDAGAIYLAEKRAGAADFLHDGRFAEAELAEALAKIRVAHERLHAA